MKNDILDVTISYLKNRPAFFSLLRPFEASLMINNFSRLKTPILDYGCGDGFFAKQVTGNKRIDVGLDVFGSRSDEAREIKVYKKIVQFDGKKIPFPASSFAGVVSNSVLEHVENLDNSIMEIHRILKKGSCFLTTVMTDKWEDNLFGKKLFGKKYLDWLRKKQHHVHLLSVKGWVDKFSKAGFEVVEIVTYLPKNNSQIMELFHIFSLPSLLSYVLFHKWVLFENWYKLFFADKMIAQLNSKILANKTQASAAFFVLRKK